MVGKCTKQPSKRTIQRRLENSKPAIPTGTRVDRKTAEGVHELEELLNVSGYGEVLDAVIPGVLVTARRVAADQKKNDAYDISSNRNPLQSPCSYGNSRLFKEHNGDWNEQYAD